MPTYYEETFAQAPLADIVPAYVYIQYNDDEYVTAFFTAFNGMAQGYLDWFNETPLPVWTNPNISGTLLDYIGNNLYGISRPVLGTSTTTGTAGMNDYAMNTQAMNSRKSITSGTSSLVSDDLYKRTLTWYLYKGDGQNFNLIWLRKRVARFLYGINGTDLSDVGLASSVHLKIASSAITIWVPYVTYGANFVNLFSNGWLPTPFNLSISASQSLVARDTLVLDDSATLTV